MISRFSVSVTFFKLGREFTAVAELAAIALYINLIANGLYIYIHRHT